MQPMSNKGRDRLDAPALPLRTALCPRKLVAAGALLEDVHLKGWNGHFALQGSAGV